MVCRLLLRYPNVPCQAVTMAPSLRSDYYSIKRRVRHRAKAYLGSDRLHLVPIEAIVRRLVATLPGVLGDYHIDHEVPLCTWDMDDDVQVVLAFAATNHRWLRAGTNQARAKRG